EQRAFLEILVALPPRRVAFFLGQSAAKVELAPGLLEQAALRCLRRRGWRRSRRGRWWGRLRSGRWWLRRRLRRRRLRSRCCDREPAHERRSEEHTSELPAHR